ncbi:MAG TPA: OsmC family protein [Anaerolineaceae bacterium]
MEAVWREVTADWKGERSFIAQNAAGGKVQINMIDNVPGASPMELLLMGVAGCTGIDIANILTKARQPLENLQVRVRGKFAPEGTLPRIYTDIEIEYIVWGRVEARILENAIELSTEKYCSASAMMRGVANVTHTYRILDSREETAPGQ